MSYPRPMQLWDRVQHRAMLRKTAKERQEAVKPILAARAEKKAAAVKQGRLF